MKNDLQKDRKKSEHNFNQLRRLQLFECFITQRKVRLIISRNKIKILTVNCFAVPLLLHDITPTEHILH